MASAAEADSSKKKPTKKHVEAKPVTEQNVRRLNTTMQPPPPPRPALISQQSNSLPSTPYVGARELNDQFRTPSPIYRPPHPQNQHVSRSVTDTTFRPYNARTLASGCKYESGMFNFKRRMPYSLGSDKVDSSATKVQRSIDSELEKKLTSEMRKLYEELLPTKESESSRAKFVTKLEKLLNDRWPDNGIRVHVFGSSGNSLFTNDSDVDICITTTTDALRRTCLLAKALGEAGMQNIECRPNAKVPIVKSWDPELKLACDMNVNNTAALNNTRMMKTYVEMDPRVRPLAMIIKHWTRRRILNDAALGGTLSSYTWLCMIINFLQSRNPKILPSLQKGPFYNPETDKEAGFGSASEHTKDYGNRNRESLGQLLFAFFRRYAHEVDYERFIISVREGCLIPKSDKKWLPSQLTRLCVEEPFNTDRNLGNTADDTSFRGVHLELRRAFELICKGKLEECFEPYVFPSQQEVRATSSFVFAKPSQTPRPTLTRSQSQSGSSRTPRPDAPAKKPSQSSTKQKNGNTNRRASSAMPAAKYPLPTVDVSLASGSKLHETLALQYQKLQKQEQQLRARMQNQAPAPGQMYYWDANGNQYWSNYYAQMPPNPHGRYQHSSRGSPQIPLQQFTAITNIPGISGYLPQGFLSQSFPQQTSNPPSPTMSHVQPGFRHSARRAAMAEQNQSMRSQSQPPRKVSNPIQPDTISEKAKDSKETDEELTRKAAAAWQGFSFGQRSLQDVQNAYLRNETLKQQYWGLYGIDPALYDSPIADSELDSISLQESVVSQADSITDASISRDMSRRGTVAHIGDVATAYQKTLPLVPVPKKNWPPIIVPPARPRASSHVPSHGISFFADEPMDSPLQTEPFPRFDASMKFFPEIGGRQMVDDEPSEYSTPPEHFAEIVTTVPTYSSDATMASGSTATLTQSFDGTHGFERDSERASAARPLPSTIQFGQFPAGLPFRPMQETKSEELKSNGAASNSTRSTIGMNGLGIQMNHGNPKDSAVPNGIDKQPPAPAELTLANTLKLGSVLSPVREVRTPSPTTTRASSLLNRPHSETVTRRPFVEGLVINGLTGAVERASSPLTPGAVTYAQIHQRARSVESEQRNGTREKNDTESIKVTPRKAKPTMKKEAESPSNSVQHSVSDRSSSPARPTSQASGWQQSGSTSKKKKGNRKSFSVGSISLPLNPGERKGG